MIKSRDKKLSIIDSETSRLDISVNILSIPVELFYDLNHLNGSFLDFGISNLTLRELADVILEVFFKILHDQVSSGFLSVVQFIFWSTWKLNSIAKFFHEDSLVENPIIDKGILELNHK